MLKTVRKKHFDQLTLQVGKFLQDEISLSRLEEWLCLEASSGSTRHQLALSLCQSYTQSSMNVKEFKDRLRELI